LFAMAVTPAQDVLSFIASADGKWRLSRVGRWLDKEPREYSLVVPGLSEGDPQQWFGPWSAQLLVTPDGDFVVCIASGRRRPDVLEVVSVIDLRKFKVVTAIHPSEISALEGSFRDYHLDRGGHLIVQSFTPFPRHPGDDISAGGSRVNLAVLSVPNLGLTGQCQFSEWTRSNSPTRRDGEEGCAALLSRTGGGASLSEFIAAFVDTDEVRQTVDRRPRPPQCAFLWYVSYISHDGRFEREICKGSHRGFWGNQIVTKSVENIFAVKTGEQMGSINEPTDSVDSRFAAMDGREYLLLMEGGTRLMVYEIVNGAP
jgi:hypothetical protein